MTSVVREYTEADHEPLHTIWSIAFGGGRPIPDDRSLLNEGDTVLVAETAGRVAGGLIVHRMNATRGEATLRCGGVGAVAVSPECRQSGVGTALLREGLARMHADALPLASLYPFRESYYRRFGWECAGRRYRIKCPNQRFPRLASSLPVRRLTVDDWPELKPAYTQFARRYSGMNVRNSLRWSRAVFSVLRQYDIPISIFAVGDPVEAYAILRISPEFWDNQDVLEFVWSTPAGYRSMLATLTGLGINKASLTWHEPSDGPFVMAWGDRGVGVEWVPPIMFRAVNVPEALRLLAPRPQDSGEFTITVDDEYLPANRGPWHVSFADGQVHVERCERAQIETGIRHFSQALLGQPSFSDLLLHGFVQAGDEPATTAAARLLQPRPTYCLDFF